jgi:hypothetical protein
LADLGSYRSTLKVSFDGTDQGQSAQWSNGYEAFVRDHAERQLTVTGVDPAYRAEVNGIAYEQPAGAACSSGAIYEPDGLATRWEPAGFLPGVVGAVEVGAETVNGVAATHYTFDERAFGPLPPSHSTGELWVAPGGNYIARYLLTTAGTADYFGEGSAGTLTMAYNVTDVNAPLTIDLPADCSQGVVDAPLMPDATDVVRMPGVVTYSTASIPSDVAKFYQQAMPAQEWHLTADPSTYKKLTYLTFVRDEQQLSILLAPAGHGTSVRLIEAPAKH